MFLVGKAVLFSKTGKGYGKIDDTRLITVRTHLLKVFGESGDVQTIGERIVIYSKWEITKMALQKVRVPTKTFIRCWRLLKMVEEDC